jgi:hypothetical protein
MAEREREGTRSLASRSERTPTEYVFDSTRGRRRSALKTGQPHRVAAAPDRP